MDEDATLDCLAALAQPTRLAAFRLLVRHEPEGLPAGVIARELDVPHNTMSSHLAVLARAGLAVSERQSRSIIYRAGLGRMQAMVAFLVQDCCGGTGMACGPLLESLGHDDHTEPTCKE